MDYNFKHYLVFSYGKVEVFEPIGFDASDFVIEQDKDKWGRDTYYGSENISLYFGNEISEPLDTERILDNGMILRHKTSGLELLLNENKVYGAEAVVGYELEQNGNTINIGEFDFGETFKTDGLTYVECKIVQNLEQAKIKRREDVKVDLFATEDLDENIITPIQTQRMLLRAKPIYQESEFKSSDIEAFGFASVLDREPIIPSDPHDGNTIIQGANNAYIVTKYGIDNTLSFIGERYALNEFGFPNNGLSFSYIKFQEDATDVNISITDLEAYTSQNKNDFFTNIVLSGSGYARLVVKYGYDNGFGNDLTTIILYEKTFGFVDNTPIEYLPTSFDLNIPFIAADMTLWIYLEPYAEATFNGNGIDSLASYDIYAVMQNMNVKINAITTSISSVIETVRYIDLMNQTYKAIGSGSVIAPKFDAGGQFYDQFCFNGKLIRQIITEPFYNDLKETVKSLDEVCADSQINKYNNYIGQYTDYYPNIDLGGFLVLPDKEFDITKNKRYLINKFNYGYEKFEKDRDEDNTLDAIHTESEWYVPNNKSENEKKVKNNFVRDPFKTESVRRRATERDNTASESDDDIFIIDIVSLAPDSREEFTRVLKFEKSSTNNTFKILANKNFSWDLLGFNIGNTILVDGISYLVLDIESTVLTLDYTGSSSNGSEPFTINYPLTNVGFVNRTNQELIFSENLQNYDNFSNLRYSIKRNIKHWFPYLATAGKFIPTKSIKNTYFKANGECTTQFVGDPLPIKENESILIADITDEKIISQNIIKTTVTASFDKIKKLLDDMQVVNLDNTIGGFIRVQDNNGRVLKGYIQKATYLWKYEELALELEERNESDFLNITYYSGILTINEVGYDVKTSIEKRFNIFNDTIQFFDENNVYLCNRTNFSLVSFNGIVYNSADELAIAIQSV